MFISLFPPLYPSLPSLLLPQLFIYLFASWEGEPMTGSEGRHILVTGGAGFIGSHASLALLEAG